MKKALIVSGLVYTFTCIGMCIWIICKPEAYGVAIGKMITGITKGLEKKEEETDA